MLQLTLMGCKEKGRGDPRAGLVLTHHLWQSGTLREINGVSGRDAGSALQAHPKGKQDHGGQSKQPGTAAKPPWVLFPSVERGEEAPYLLPWPMDLHLLSI